MHLPSKDAMIEALGGDLWPWAHRCHEASLYLVKSGVFTSDLQARVARGTRIGVMGQHSWVVIGGDCYNPKRIVDPTLWSYIPEVVGIYIGGAVEYRPHGSGSIYQYGKPTHQGGDTIELEADLSPAAHAFLKLIGPLDRKGWMVLANAPVHGWPAREIIEAMYDDPRLSPLIPIDIVGMLTDRNPDGLYLP